MKRWKITTAKLTPVTCENCEEGRLFVCRPIDGGALLIRKRVGCYVYGSCGGGPCMAYPYTFIRYLDPDPETPKQVRFADVGDGVVFTCRRIPCMYWKDSDQVCWTYDTDRGSVNSIDGLFRHDELVTLTGQGAELVEDE